MPLATVPHESRTKLLEATIQVVRAKGYAATTIDDICAAAKLTKGSFFHHFKSKEDLAVAAAEYWDQVTSDFFASAPYQAKRDPLQRLLAYIDFRKAIIRGELPEFTCLAGTMVQEVFASHPSIREACDTAISRHAAKLEADIAAAMRLYRVRAKWTAASLALHTQAVIQGAFVLAKAKNGADVALDSLDHLKRYLQLLFVPPHHKEE